MKNVRWTYQCPTHSQPLICYWDLTAKPLHLLGAVSPPSVHPAFYYCQKTADGRDHMKGYWTWYHLLFIMHKSHSGNHYLKLSSDLELVVKSSEGNECIDRLSGSGLNRRYCYNKMIIYTSISTAKSMQSLSSTLQKSIFNYTYCFMQTLQPQHS